MSVWLPAVFTGLITLLLGAFGLAMKRREQSGRIDTTSAEVLWASIRGMLEIALADNATQRAEARSLKAEVVSLTAQVAEGSRKVAALQEEVAGLRSELRELSGKVG